MKKITKNVFAALLAKQELKNEIEELNALVSSLESDYPYSDALLGIAVCAEAAAEHSGDVDFSASDFVAYYHRVMAYQDMLDIDEAVTKAIKEDPSSYLVTALFTEDVIRDALHQEASCSAAHLGYQRQEYWQDFDYYANSYIGDYLVTRDVFRTYGEACNRFIDCLHAYEDSYGGEFEGCESIGDFKSRARELGYLDEYAAYIIAFKIVKQMLGNVALPFESCTIDEFAFKCLALEDALTGTIAEIEKQL